VSTQQSATQQQQQHSSTPPAGKSSVRTSAAPYKPNLAPFFHTNNEEEASHSGSQNSMVATVPLRSEPAPLSAAGPASMVKESTPLMLRYTVPVGPLQR
jgi:hypothetical protein